MKNIIILIILIPILLLGACASKVSEIDYSEYKLEDIIKDYETDKDNDLLYELCIKLINAELTESNCSMIDKYYTILLKQKGNYIGLEHTQNYAIKHLEAILYLNKLDEFYKRYDYYIEHYNPYSFVMYLYNEDVRNMISEKEEEFFIMEFKRLLLKADFQEDKDILGHCIMMYALIEQYYTDKEEPQILQEFEDKKEEMLTIVKEEME